MKPFTPAQAPCCHRAQPRAWRLLAAGLLAATLSTQAQTQFTWDGGDGSSPLWSTAGNWSPDGAPAADFKASLTFEGTLNLGTPGNPLLNDLLTGTLSNLTFSAGAGTFYLGGNTVTNAGNIVNNSGVPQVLGLGLVLSPNVNSSTTHFLNVGTGVVTNSGAFLAPTATASLAKIGAGTLYFTSPLTNQLGNGTPGGSSTNWIAGFSVDEGAVVFDGGPTSVYNVAGQAAFGRSGATANKNVLVTIQSGRVTSSDWIAVARGNGAGEVTADLVMNGASVFIPVNFSAGYNAGDGSRRPRSAITLNGTAQFSINNNNNNNIFGESPGSYVTLNVNDSAQLTVGNGTSSRARLGNSGRFVLKLNSPTATVTLNQVHFGDAAGGAGAFYNRGKFIVKSGASVDHFAIGSATGNATPTNNSYGYYLHDTSSLLELSEIGVGGSGGGDGVLEVRQGTVNVTNWITLGRSQSVTNGAMQSALLLIRNGTLYGPNVEQFRAGWSASGISEYSVVDVGAGGKLTGLGSACALNLSQTANANNFGILTLSGGASLELNRVFGANAAPQTCVNFNGCTVSPMVATTTFLGANLDGVFVHAGGVTFDTKGFDITTVPLLATPYDSGVVSIPVTSPGAGYIGRPIVKITGDGMGATAVANWDEASGSITGISITSPGSGYGAPPTVELVGGGFTNAATLGTPVLGPVTGGGLTKVGLGTLTLGGGASYPGPTLVLGGGLNVAAANFQPSLAGALTVSNATLTVDLSGFTSLPASSVTLRDNATLNFNYGTVTINPPNPAIVATGTVSIPGTNVVINILGFGMQVGQFPVLKYTGAAPNLANVSLGTLPPGVVATLVNNPGTQTIDLDITKSGQNLTWYGGLGPNWDINTTMNWTVNFTPGSAYYLEYGTANPVGDPVRFDDTLFNDFINPPATNVNLTTVLRPFMVTVDSAGPFSLLGPGRLSGMCTLVKSNTGSLTLGTSNDYTGGTWVYNGSLVISNDAALGLGTSPLNLAGGTLDLEGSLASKRPFNLAGSCNIATGPGVAAVLGGSLGGGNRVSFQGAGTVTLTNNSAMQFHVLNGTLIFDGSARITNTLNYTSIGLGNTVAENGILILRSNAFFEISPDLNIADINDSRGRLEIRDNAVLRTRQLWIGKNNLCTGLVYQAGGVVTNHLTDGSDWRLGGNDANGFATFGGYYLSGGRLDVQKNFQIGAYGVGEMIVSGGAFNAWAGYPVVGRYTNSTGLLVVSGGQFNQLNTGTALIIGENGTGTLLVTNTGVVSLTNAVRIGGGGFPGTGTVILGTGGRLVTPGVLMPVAGVSTFEFNGGTVQARGHNSTFMQGLTTASIRAGGAVIDTAGYDITIDQALLSGGGNGGLTKNGLGTLILAGANTYTGTTLVSTGRVLLSPAHLASGPVTVADGAAFGVSLTGGGTVTVGSVALGATGATTFDFSFGTNGNPTAPVLFTGPLTVNGTCTVRLAGRLAVGTFPLVKYTGTLGGSGSFSPVVNGPQGMVAALTVDAANNLLLVTISSLGPGLVWSGANTNTALTNLWDLNSTTNWLVNGTPTTYQELVPPGDAVRFDDAGSGTVILNSSANPNSILVTNVTRSYTIRGTGRIAGSTGLTKAGSGTLTMALSGNDYSGDTTVAAGTLQLASTNAIPDGPGKGNLVIQSGATLELAGWNETLSGLAGSGQINNSTSTNIVLTVGNGDSASAWDGTLGNSGAGGIALTKVGGGTLSIGGANTLNNGAASQVNGGALVIPTNGSLTLGSAELWIAQAATTGSVVVAGGTLTLNNWLAIGRNASNAVGTLTVNSGRVVKAGGNNIVLGSLGGTGILTVNGGEVLNNGMLWLGEGATANAYLYLNGGLVQAAQVRGNDNGGLPLTSEAYFNGGILQATADSADFLQSTAWIQNRGLVLDDGGFAITIAAQPLQEDATSPGGGLLKTGAGTVYLNALNTYTGLTLVTNGMLAGTGAISGPVQVTLGGTIGAGVAGTAVGTLTLNNTPLSLQGNAAFRIEKSGGVTRSDQLAGISMVTYGGKLTVSALSGDALAVGDKFYLFAAANRAGSFTSLALPSPGPSLGWKNNLLADGSIEVIEVTVVQPVITGVSVGSGNLVITGTNGTPGQTCRVLASGDATLPLSSWLPVYTNTFTGSAFSLSIPTDPAVPQRFYRLSVP